jgi:hypothetical protein
VPLVVNSSGFCLFSFINPPHSIFEVDKDGFEMFYNMDTVTKGAGRLILVKDSPNQRQ